jgi:SpoVK/Ycf46/Vps4 family AAA+-type ATPase
LNKPNLEDASKILQSKLDNVEHDSDIKVAEILKSFMETGPSCADIEALHNAALLRCLKENIIYSEMNNSSTDIIILSMKHYLEKD